MEHRQILIRRRSIECPEKKTSLSRTSRRIESPFVAVNSTLPATGTSLAPRLALACLSAVMLAR